MPRFVVLRHEKDAGVHFDLMLEHGGVLLTFSFADFPASGATCGKIFDHRLKYLDFEGNLVEKKGRVTRVDGGMFDLVALSADAVHASLRGERLQGNLRLTLQPGDTWRLEGE